MEVSGRKDFKKRLSKARSSQDLIFCQSCHRENENVPAEGFCESCSIFLCCSCIKAHCTLPLLRNHVIKSKDEMPKTGVHADPCLELCALHKNEIVKFYCQGHNEVGCGDCMVLNHKTCKVELVTEVSSNYGNSKELRKINNNIKKIVQQIKSTKKDIESNLKDATDINLKVVEEIKKFRKDLNAYLDNAEAELLKEVEQLKRRDVRLQKKLQTECQSMQKELDHFQSKLEKNASKINQLFVSAKLACKRLRQCQGSIDRITSECQINMYKFKPAESFMSEKVKTLYLGSVSKEKKQKDVTKQRQNNMIEKKLELVRRCNVQANDEKKKCFISGLALISNDEIMMADSNNFTLKIFNVRKNKISSIYQLLSYPWDLSVIEPGQVGVTMPVEKRIIFMNTKKHLSLSHNLKVTGGCYGIDHRNGLLAVSFCFPPCVQILNMNGNIQHEVRDTSMLILPYFIAFSKADKSIHVSDSSKFSMFSFTFDGKLKSTVKCEKDSNPMSLAVTSDGTVIVCCEKISNSLSMIVPHTKTLIHLPIEHVQKPISILVCEEQNKIYIGEHSSSKELVKVFDMK